MNCATCGKDLEDGGYSEQVVVKDGVETRTTWCRQCRKILDAHEYMASRVIRTHLWTEASLDTYRNKEDAPKWAQELVDSMERVGELQKKFQKEVWFNGQEPHKDDDLTKPWREGEEWDDMRSYKKGQLPPEGSLQRFVVQASWKGYKAQVGGVKYLSYTICGRSCFQIEDDVALVNLIFDEDSPSPRGGIQGIHATEEQAAALIEQAISDWKGGRMNLEPDTGVGFPI